MSIKKRDFPYEWVNKFWMNFLNFSLYFILTHDDTMYNNKYKYRGKCVLYKKVVNTGARTQLWTCCVRWTDKHFPYNFTPEIFSCMYLKLRLMSSRIFLYKKKGYKPPFLIYHKKILAFIYCTPDLEFYTISILCIITPYV